MCHRVRVTVSPHRTAPNSFTVLVECSSLVYNIQCVAVLYVCASDVVTVRLYGGVLCVMCCAKKAEKAVSVFPFFLFFFRIFFKPVRVSRGIAVRKSMKNDIKL